MSPQRLPRNPDWPATQALPVRKSANGFDSIQRPALHKNPNHRPIPHLCTGPACFLAFLNHTITERSEAPRLEQRLGVNDSLAWGFFGCPFGLPRSFFGESVAAASKPADCIRCAVVVALPACLQEEHGMQSFRFRGRLSSRLKCLMLSGKLKWSRSISRTFEMVCVSHGLILHRPGKLNRTYRTLVKAARTACSCQVTTFCAVDDVDLSMPDKEPLRACPWLCCSIVAPFC